LLAGQSKSALPGTSDIGLFSYCESIVRFATEVSSGAFDLGVTWEKLHRSEIAGAPVDQGCFGSSQ
jgi:hypothetical protein